MRVRLKESGLRMVEVLYGTKVGLLRFWVVNKLKQGHAMMNKKRIAVNFVFYLCSVLLTLFITVFSIREYEWMVDDGSVNSICDIPYSDGDGVFTWVVLLLFVPFIFFKRNVIYVRIALIIFCYYLWCFHLKYYGCWIK